MTRFLSYLRRDVLVALTFLLVALAGLPGCASLSRPDPDRRYYLLQVQRPEPALERPAEAPILAVRSFRVAPAYDSRGIVTIRPDGLVQRDFYERFFLPPGEMLAEQFRNWLGQAGIFSLVTDLGGLTEPDLILEGYVQELHRDLRDGRREAVLALQMLLLRPNRLGAMEVVVQRDYRQELTLSDGSIASLVAGWNLALTMILSDVETAFRSASFSGAVSQPSQGRLQGSDQ
ncbi:ABC-type transport auxiliary lipoprotein family protein [Desulfonatronum thiodismutans]|uniref:ABC-type transport auxiliary lipoprotein family protein n=1 Tax=Desulfonatronum thiodismutans TaxID=159290 RepID=UPI0004ABD699|nr:ABC-type transport auxiliary lipoprotein family protein [Desulfonatronum thiodismutans]